jgi:hypothetical protein
MTKGQRDAILNAKTPEDAARAIDHFYERSDRKSTRDRMKAAREFFGTKPAPAAPTAETPAAEDAPASPGLRLKDPFADPITQLEQSGEMIDIIGIEDVQFSPAQVAQMDELYAASTDRMRRTFRAKQAEQQSVNASKLLLGLVGVGDKVTTEADILGALERGDIGIEDVAPLVQTRERMLDRREAALDREESRAEREEAKRKERAATGATEELLGAVFNGNMTAPEARRQAMRIAADPRISFEVRAQILGNVNSVANAYESAVENSDEVRSFQGVLAERSEDPEGRITLLVPGMRPERARAFAPQYTSIVQRASGRFIRDVANGVKPAVARDNADAYLIEEEAKLVSRLKTNTTTNGQSTGR